MLAGRGLGDGTGDYFRTVSLKGAAQAHRQAASLISTPHRILTTGCRATTKVCCSCHPSSASETYVVCCKSHVVLFLWTDAGIQMLRRTVQIFMISQAGKCTCCCWPRQHSRNAQLALLEHQSSLLAHMERGLKKRIKEVGTYETPVVQRLYLEPTTA